MSTENASKRKASAKNDRPTKKTKPTDKATSNDKPTNAKLQAAADAKTSRKRAAEFIEDDATPVAVPAEDSPKTKKAKISKKVAIVEPEPVASKISKLKDSKEDKSTAKRTKKSKDERSEAVVVAAQENEIAPPADDDEEEDVAALLAGFSSDEDEVGVDVAEGGVPLDQLPVAKMDKKARKALEKANNQAAEEQDTPGTLYIGRIPHGFYEPQMRSYFSQFGTIINLRLSRNKKTGASKHYAFVQFESSKVADIVARTMNNYLMFGHILKVRLMPAEQVHPEMWKGANKRFKVVPRGMLERKEMEKSKGRGYWKEKVEKEETKREAKKKAMKELGYEYVAPALKNVDDVPVKEAGADAKVAIENGKTEKVVEETRKAIAAKPTEVDEVQVEVEKLIKKEKAAKEDKKEKVKVKAIKKAKA